ncbi:MAG TPA: hypothetical protein VE287_05620, partial [Actinopolymorphaceae bacterium]|nr:hypothetical protein [Actinopolymorphaceae bacterium]
RLTREGAPGVLHDPDGTALHRLGAAGPEAALYLVRPDGYIGFVGGAGALPRLQTYLAEWLRPG